MNEVDIISSLAKCFTRSPRQRNGLFECDAELIEIGGELWAATIDEFSASEDGFPADDPALLGANLAAATLSDLYACGAQPVFFMQALCLPPHWDEAFVETLGRGIAGALEAAGCHLCGGDLGRAELWRFSGVALGRVPAGRAAVTRKIDPAREIELWISGPLGDANLIAAAGRGALTLELRLEIARWIGTYAAAAIDTSGGLWDALWMLARLNPALRFELELDAVPLAAGVAEFARAAGLPPTAALIGGAGEYELLFAVAPEVGARHRTALANLGATCIGHATPGGEPGFFARRQAWDDARPAPPCPDARSGSSRKTYLEEVARAAMALEQRGRCNPNVNEERMDECVRAPS